MMSLRPVTLPGVTYLPGEAPDSFAGKPAGYRGYRRPAEIERTANVEGAPLPLYRMTDNRHPWPAHADVVRLLGGFTCRQIDGGGGLDQLTTLAGLLDVVSPQAVAIAAGFALRADRVTHQRAAAVCAAVGEGDPAS